MVRTWHIATRLKELTTALFRILLQLLEVTWSGIGNDVNGVSYPRISFQLLENCINDRVGFTGLPYKYEA